MKNGNPDVVVVGGGPTGLLTAGELRRRGLTVRLVEKHAQRQQLSKALVVQARTLEQTDLLEVAAQCVEIDVGHRKALSSQPELGKCTPASLEPTRRGRRIRASHSPPGDFRAMDCMRRRNRGPHSISMTSSGLAREFLVRCRRPSQIYRMERVPDCGIIAPRRKSSAHLHRPRRAIFPSHS